MLARTGKVAAVVERHAHQKQRLHPDAGIVQFLGVVDRLAGELQGQVHLAADDAPGEVAPHHRELLLRTADPLAKLPRAMKGGTDLRRRVAAHGDIGGAKRAQDLKFQLVPRLAFGEGLQQASALSRFCTA